MTKNTVIVEGPDAEIVIDNILFLMETNIVSIQKELSKMAENPEPNRFDFLDKANKLATIVEMKNNISYFAST
jgi:hypothetical protein